MNSIDIELFDLGLDQPMLDVVPGTRVRNWLSPHAYRCTPLAVSNTFGWDLIIPKQFTATWDGDTSVASDSGVQVTEGEDLVQSHFGIGTFTFTGGRTWRTPPGWQIHVGPVPNEDLLGIQACSAIIETDWMPYPWFLTVRFTGPGTVTMPAGTPIARVMPIQIAPVVDGNISVKPETGVMRVEREVWSHDREKQVRDETDKLKGARKWTRQYFDRCKFRSAETPELERALEVKDEAIGFVETLRQQDIYVFENFLTPTECKRMVRMFEPFNPPDQDPTGPWVDRVCWPKWPSYLSDKLERVTTDLASKVFGYELEQINLHLAIWREGDSLVSHTDLGQGLTEFPLRQFAAVWYLNEDYEGGEFQLPHMEANVRFDAGTMILFAGGRILHGVTEITKGKRFTAISWFGTEKAVCETLGAARLLS